MVTYSNKLKFLISLFLLSIICKCYGKNDTVNKFDIKSDTTKIQNESLSYKQILSQIESKRKSFSKEYNNVRDDSKRKRILQESRDYLYEALTNKIFPQWYGTKWDFNGTTLIPNQGKIACGYFVTIILKQIGFKINSVKLAQQPSSYMIRNLTSQENIFYFSNNAPISKVIDKIREKGKGIFIVGLDCHTGFIVFDGKEYIRFIHSSYYDPPLCVVSQELDAYGPFKFSKYRVIGKIFEDKMMINWLNNASIPIKYEYTK